MKSVSLYQFGGSEELLNRIQRPLVKYFYGAAPVLDIGCGRGIFLTLLAAAGIPSIGIDHSVESIEACKAKGLAALREDAREYLKFHSGEFGGIFCSHVIEHMAYDDVLGFLQLCNAALRPDGTILIITPNPKDLSVISEVFWLDPTHVRPYPGPLLTAMLDATGFQVILQKHALGSWRMIGKRNILRYLFRRALLGDFYGKPNTIVLARKREALV